MSVSIDVEDAAWEQLPELESVAVESVTAALARLGIDASATQVALLFTDDASIAEINGEWRGKPKPTNVLSFPSPPDMAVPPGELRPLGDIVLASGTVAREAAEQGKTLREHTAHLIVHGVLHLLGKDHEDDVEAEDMERLEAEILKGLDISDPYER